jgi:sterol desaturase/sphingolipid hydroxylase (fatty acid hydroxylase superfamily)
MAAYLTEHFRSVTLVLLRAGAWLVILSAIFVPLERLFALHPQKIFRKEVAVDLGYYFLNALVVALVLGPPVAIIAFVIRHVVPGSVVGTLSALPIWARACAAMVVGETGYYWGHRWTHQIPFLWRFHAVHHSAEQLDFLVSSRAHPVDLVFTRMCMLTPLLALGLVNMMHATDGVIPLIVFLTGTVWGFFIHSNFRWRLGPLEWVITTPGFHHWHHTYAGRERDCNYSSLLPWLDRVFGTHYLPKSWPERYGIHEPIARTLTGQLIQPMQASHATATMDRPGAAPDPVVKPGEAGADAPAGPRAQSAG